MIHKENKDMTIYCCRVKYAWFATLEREKKYIPEQHTLLFQGFRILLWGSEMWDINEDVLI